MLSQTLDHERSMSEHEAEMAIEADEEIRFFVRILLRTLRRQDAIVLKLAYGIGCFREYTDREIANKLKVSERRIGQLRQRALQELRHRLQLTEVFAP